MLREGMQTTADLYQQPLSRAEVGAVEHSPRPTCLRPASSTCLSNRRRGAPFVLQDKDNFLTQPFGQWLAFFLGVWRR